MKGMIDACYNYFSIWSSRWPVSAILTKRYDVPYNYG